MFDRRERPALMRSTLGERKLPKGRVSVWLLALLLAGCAPVLSQLPSPSVAGTATPVPTGPGGIPTLGTTPPSGLVFQTYFVTLTDPKNGSVGVLTTPGSRCSLSVSAPTGAATDQPAQIVGPAGTVAFTYPPVGGRGESIQTVRCTLGDASQVAKGQVVLP